MREPIEHRFGGCVLRMWPSTRYCETVFPDGSKAPATRCSTMENLDYARHLGYPDTWPALVEHEALHTWLMEQLGNEVSPTLWAVAQGYATGTASYEERLWEEAIVLQYQRWLRTGHVGEALEPYGQHTLRRWRAEWEATFSVPSLEAA